MDGQKMRDLVMYWQQVELDDEAAKQLANQSIGAGKALREVAVHGLELPLQATELGGDGQLHGLAAGPLLLGGHRLAVDLDQPRLAVGEGQIGRAHV